MRLPAARGPISTILSARLATGAPLGDPDVAAVRAHAAAVRDPLTDGDLQLSLAVCYQLHYTGFDGVDPAWEWDPQLLAARAALEAPFEAAVLAAASLPPLPEDAPVDVALRAVIDADDSPSLSTYLLRHATLEQFRAYVRQRSVYQLMEADPHSWGLPRLSGPTKVALAEVQFDEYGAGRPERLHQALYARLMTGLGLDPAYGAYWDEALPEAFAALNVMSLFGLHRRHRGKLLGHLAAYEMTSTTPCRRYGNGLRRLGFGPEVTDYYDEHVVADAVHEQLAAVDLCGSFAAAEPELARDVLVGAAACLLLEGRVGGALLAAFTAEVPAAS